MNEFPGSDLPHNPDVPSVPEEALFAGSGQAQQRHRALIERAKDLLGIKTENVVDVDSFYSRFRVSMSAVQASVIAKADEYQKYGITPPRDEMFNFAMAQVLDLLCQFKDNDERHLLLAILLTRTLVGRVL